MLVDFLDVDRRILNWYFEREEASDFLRYYGRDDQDLSPLDSPDSNDISASA